jgi:Fe-Mn family superoxide dismutase
LEYDYKSLEPVISGEIMELHHKKHHQTYVTNLNAALEKYADAESKKDVATMIQLQGAIKFNGGNSFLKFFFFIITLNKHRWSC